MTNMEHIFTRTLKDAGFSDTVQRRMVFGALIGKEPMAMADIVASVRPDVDRASVYRTIELFEKLGIVHRIQYGWKYKLELSDTFHLHHHHITCLTCGKVTTIDGDTHIEEDIKFLGRTHGFTITGHQLELQGYCNACHTTLA